MGSAQVRCVCDPNFPQRIDLRKVETLKSPSGKLIQTKGKKLAQVLRAEGCQDAPPPKSKKDKKGTYYTDHAFTHGY